jgi:hypothetical protein
MVFKRKMHVILVAYYNQSSLKIVIHNSTPTNACLSSSFGRRVPRAFTYHRFFVLGVIGFNFSLRSGFGLSFGLDFGSEIESEA